MLRAEVDLAGNLARLHDDIAAAAVRAGRQPEDVTLVGVSKTQPAEAVADLVRAGLRHVGENRIQEAATKFPLVRQLLERSAEITLHMVGHLQTNKAAVAVGLFDCIDSVDSLHLAQALSKRHVARDDEEPLKVRLEVYVGDDPRRPGLRPDQLVEVAGQILEVPRLRVEGLMTVAPLAGDARAAFSQVRELKLKLSESYPRVHFGVLSMGMSEDYVLAIQEGSTEVRIGTALFGPRQPR
jgi:pyridoxal phosphate enzyme (YggS family)